MLSALWLPAASCERHENTLTSRLRLCQGARSPLQLLGFSRRGFGNDPKAQAFRWPSSRGRTEGAPGAAAALGALGLGL